MKDNIATLDFTGPLMDPVQFGSVHLMAQEQGLELSLGPVVHCVGQQLHGDGVDSQEVAHKHDSLNVLDRGKKRHHHQQS